MFLALWMRCLWPVFRTPDGTSTWTYIREMDGQQQEYRIVITGTTARETHVAGGTTALDITTELTPLHEAPWVAQRCADLFFAGWRLAEVRGDSRIPSAGV